MLSFLSLFNHLFISSWTHGYLFYTLGYNPILLYIFFIYFFAQVILVLDIGTYFTWLLCLFDIQPSMFFFCLFLSTSPFSSKPCGISVPSPEALRFMDRKMSRRLARLSWTGRILEIIDAQSRRTREDRLGGRAGMWVGRAQVYRTGWKYKVVVSDLTWRT